MPRFTSCLTAAIPLIASIAIGTGCGGGSNSADAALTADAGIDAPSSGGACGTAASTITAYPGTYTGSTAAGAGTLTVAMGVCTQEDNYDGAAGVTQTVVLNNLTAGKTYVVNLVTTEDLLFYVATSCDAAGPTSTGCLLYEDQSSTNETGTFVAPTSGSVSVIVSSFAALASGAQGVYTLNVAQAECATSTDCTDASKPICSTSFTCVACQTDIDCTTGAAPTCDTTSNSCVAGVASTCTGDDSDEPSNYPAQATTLAYPTANTPTVHHAAVCNIPATESDFYKFTATAAGSLTVDIDWTLAGADLDAQVLDSTGAQVAAGTSTAPSEHFSVSIPAAGTYYLQVDEFSAGTPTDPQTPITSAAATAYTVTLQVSNCTTSFDCTNAATQVCDAGACGAGPALCTGDDTADMGNGDDGPTGATNITVAVGSTSTPIDAVECNIVATEQDWYKTTVAAGEGLVITTSWQPTTNAFLTLVFDSTGAVVGASEYLNPSVTTLTYLPAGTYFIEVANTSTTTPSTDSSPYALTVKRTAAQSCATAADCAGEFNTQFYRGDCQATGDKACHYITASGTIVDGGACDTGIECSSNTCSADLELFGSHQQKAICTPAAGCSADADCASLGTGFTCYTDFGFCIPACTKDTDCGADSSITTPTTGLPWAYGTCDTATGDCTAAVAP